MKNVFGIVVVLLALTFGFVQVPCDVYAAGSPESGAEMTKVSVNQADKDTLTQVPGIGPKTAEGIVEYRKSAGKITNLDQLLDVKGIGEKKLAKMKQYLTL